MIGYLRHEETKMIDHDQHHKLSQMTIIHYVFKMALNEINGLSDTLRAIHPSKYEAEKMTIERLAYLIHEKIHDIKGLMEEMINEQRPFGIN